MNGALFWGIVIAGSYIAGIYFHHRGSDGSVDPKKIWRPKIPSFDYLIQEFRHKGLKALRKPDVLCFTLSFGSLLFVVLCATALTVLKELKN
jgi:hypothetical protein